MTHSPEEPIRKTVTVPLAPRDAFELFTDGIDRWWPKETHSLSAGKTGQARVRVEPWDGGRVIEKMPDGTEAPWADVTHYAPGARLTLRWYVGRSPEEATVVDIRFSAVEAGTRIDLTHSGFEALGNQGHPVSAQYRTGWDHVLGQCYARACEGLVAAGLGA